VPIIALTGDANPHSAGKRRSSSMHRLTEGGVPETLAQRQHDVALALAMHSGEIIRSQGFRREDFAALHPAASSVGKLLLRVAT